MISCDQAVGSMPNERNEATSSYVRKKALKVVLLRGGELCRIDCAAGHTKAPAPQVVRGEIDQRLCLKTRKRGPEGIATEIAAKYIQGSSGSSYELCRLETSANARWRPAAGRHQMDVR